MLVASLLSIAADDTILCVTSYADMLSLLSRRAGAVPSAPALQRGRREQKMPVQIYVAGAPPRLLAQPPHSSRT